LVYRHGSRSQRIAERAQRRPSEARVVCVCEPVIEAEVRYVLQHEHARSVADVSRRTRLGLGACGGMRCAARCGAIVAEERGLSPTDGLRQSLTFMHRQARTRTCALGPEQARQEALVIASLRSQMGIVGHTSLAARKDPESVLSRTASDAQPTVVSSRPPAIAETAE
jgi:glycerol-3-phosphate dehydrogenase